MRPTNKTELMTASQNLYDQLLVLISMNASLKKHLRGCLDSPVGVAKDILTWLRLIKLLKKKLITLSAGSKALVCYIYE
ncbi:hypothetical protein F5ESL0236_01870 [Lactobacillus sp. ESL0236]|nr:MULTISPECIES: hypothetical protein [unclassified Lactobacillus]RMC40683.1 hypothetical protein F5ESL0237_01865 [Lactobacillus sp. ESL0237]RMC44441.1 hypothetical protein F5ESL0234_01865 [Lactobacillus sp. ESL0234]RMC45747.1 hypothetical protein F5ESL0236_01870 [Lactobacillus sp. ESL0236]